MFVSILAIGLAFTFLRPPEYRSEATIAIYRTSPTPASPIESASETVASISGDVREAEAEPAAVLMEARRLLAWPMLLSLHERLREVLGESSPPTAADLQQMLGAETKPETNVIELSATGRGRDVLPAILQTWIGLYVAEKDARKTSEGASNREELAQQVTEIEQRLAAQRSRLEAFRAVNDIVSLEREDNQTAASVKGLNASLAKAVEKKAETEARVAAMRQDISNGKTVLRREDRTEIAAMEGRAREMQEVLREADKGYTAAYIRLDPRLRAAQENLQALERKIAEAKARSQQEALAEAEQEMAGAAENVANLQRQIDASKAAAIAFAARFSEHKALVAELEQTEKLSRAANARLLRAEMADRSRLPRVVVVAPPSRPESHVWPHYARDAAISVAAALVLAIAAILLRDFLHRSSTEREGPQPLVHIAMPSGGVLGTFGAPPATALPTPPLALPATPSLPRELSPFEAAALWNAADAQGRIAIAALLNGLSASETVALQWSDVDASSGSVHVPGNPPRTVPMGAGLREALTPIRQTDDGPVLVTPTRTALEPADLAGMVAAAAHDAGLAVAGGVTTEALRHTYLAFLVRQGARFADLARIAGYLPPTALMAYGPLSPPGPGRPLDAVNLSYPLAS
jgi:succinoglycan biosynthesis transport protein ExoP